MQKLEIRYKNMKQLFLGYICVTLVAIFCFGFTQPEKLNLNRTKGIIIEDENSTDTILKGSAIPFSKDRMRTDSLLVRKYWESKFKNPDQYKEWYKKYKNSTEGKILLLLARMAH
jgi:hypothetical protein